MSNVPVRHGNDAEHRRLIANEINRLNKSNIIIVDDADMSNGWVKLDSTRQPRYWIDGFGVVHLSGFIKSGTINTKAFTLPEGYIPDFIDATGVSQIFPTSSNNAFGQVAINYLGEVNPSIGSNVWVSLDGITFKAT